MTSSAQILSRFAQLQQSFIQDPYPDYRKRKKGLIKLRTNILKYHNDIRQALYHDLGKSEFESDSTEILIVLRELKKAIQNLYYWMQDQSVKTDLLLFGTSSYIRHEPKGVVAIISPWNYPINLSLSPLIAAYSAGNKVMVKTSEYSPHCTQVLRTIIEESFSKEEVAFIEGDAEVSSKVCKLPLSMIFFTGSGAVGKKILQAASINLTPCTLELGGKCPVVIDEEVNLRDIVKHIAFAKVLNAGQTCIAPDFILLKESQLKEFIQLWNHWIQDKFGSDICRSNQYGKIVNQKHFERIENLLEISLQEGCEFSSPINKLKEEMKIALIAISKVSWKNTLMKNEIFGPVLPILTYQDESQLLQNLNQLERPLNLYIFSNRKRFINRIIENTRSGGVTINQCMLNYIESNLPFGGDLHSGNGRYHSKYGFLEFSHKRSISKKGMLISTLELFHPPYHYWKIKLKNLLLKLYS